MATRTVYLDRTLPALTPSDSAGWRLWLARHGLPDPDSIPLGGEIVCDDDARTVTVEVVVLNDKGRPILDGDRYARESVTVQLEAPALPVPAGLRVRNES